MPIQKKIVVVLTTKFAGNSVPIVESILANTIKPDVVFVNLSTIEFPKRMNDVPQQMGKLLMRNPAVKPIWDGVFPALEEDKYEIIRIDCNEEKKVAKDFIEKHLTFRPHEYLDMTMVSVFYDAGINELRKTATMKATQNWVEQYHLPSEMIFMELGFNGVFTFSEKDFPEQIKYVRVDGDNSHKYLFQKEHLWNIAAKNAKNEKLMFIDSDIAPIGDVDWFKKVHDALDRCLFTQGFNGITYLDEYDQPTGRYRETYTRQVVNKGKLSYAVPGGVYCITQDTLKMMGYFNYLPFGGGDNLFWAELAGILNHYPWFTLCRRDTITPCINTLLKLTGKNLLEAVPVDVYHFYHGESKGRSYRQRHYMAISQFPLNDRIITEDVNGLLKWVDTNHYFYGVMSNLHTVNNEQDKANDLMKEHINYMGFVCELETYIKKFEKYKKKYSQRPIVFDIITNLIKKYTLEPKPLPTNTEEWTND